MSRVAFPVHKETTRERATHVKVITGFRNIAENKRFIFEFSYIIFCNIETTAEHITGVTIDARI